MVRVHVYEFTWARRWIPPFSTLLSMIVVMMIFRFLTMLVVFITRIFLIYPTFFPCWQDKKPFALFGSDPNEISRAYTLHFVKRAPLVNKCKFGSSHLGIDKLKCHAHVLPVSVFPSHTHKRQALSVQHGPLSLFKRRSSVWGCSRGGRTIWYLTGAIRLSIPINSLGNKLVECVGKWVHDRPTERGSLFARVCMAMGMDAA